MSIVPPKNQSSTDAQVVTSPPADTPPKMLAGKERHDLGRPHDQGYPVRAVRTRQDSVRQPARIDV